MNLSNPMPLFISSVFVHPALPSENHMHPSIHNSNNTFFFFFYYHCYLSASMLLDHTLLLTECFFIISIKWIFFSQAPWPVNSNLLSFSRICLLFSCPTATTMVEGHQYVVLWITEAAYSLVAMTLLISYSHPFYMLRRQIRLCHTLQFKSFQWPPIALR